VKITLQGKVFLLVAALMAVTAAVALGVVGFSLKSSLVEEQELRAKETLKVSALFIVEGAENMQGRINDALQDQRQALKRHLSLIMSALQQENEELRAGIISAQDAHAAALSQAARSSAASGLNVFISDRSAKGLAHANPGLIGQDWSTFKGGSQKNPQPYPTALLERDNSGSLLVWWPAKDSELTDKHLASVEVFGAWGWHVGVSIPFDRLEARFQEYRTDMVHDIVATLSLVRQGRSGRMFLLDASGSYLLAPPRVMREALAGSMEAIGTVDSGPDNPVRLRCGGDGQEFAVFVSSLPELKWRMGLVMDAAELTAPAMALARTQMLAIGGVFLAGMLLAWAVARWIARPIHELSACVGSFKPLSGGLEPIRNSLESLARSHPGDVGDLALVWASTIEALDKGLSDLHAAWAAQDDAARQLASSKAELLELNRELEERVQVRTAALEAANSKLRGSEARYRSLFISSPIAFLDCDFSALAELAHSPEMAAVEDFPELMRANPDLPAECSRLTRVLDANPAAVELFGARNRYELLQTLHTLGAPGNGEFYAALFSGQRFGTHGFSLEMTFTNLLGQERHAFADARPMPGFEHSLGHVLISVMDITQRKIDERRLRSAHEQAQASNRAKSDFLANMSHEIRTPISAILGLADLSQRQSDPAKTTRHLRMIADSAKTLLAIIGDVLDLSRVEAGKLTLEKVPFAPRITLERVLETFRDPCREKNISLNLRLAPDIPEQLLGDPVRLGQVVSNLLGNALKFTAEGHISLAVSVLKAKDGLVDLLVSVEDTGIGIPPGQIDAIFDSFRQVDSTLSKQYQGAGLGLAICRELTSIMGGRIWVQSAPGAGSTFHFTARFELAGPGVQDQSSKHPAVPPGDTGMRILVVEDNPVNLHVFQEFLTSLGHGVQAAEDGLLALEVLREQTFDLVFMDVQMPRMDGLEAVRRIRAGECGQAVAGLPVIALTAYAMRGDRERFIEAGMTDYLAKPVPLGTLQEIVERFSLVSATANVRKRPPEPAAQRRSPSREDYLAFLSERVDTARRRVQEGDFDTAARAGHDIKGTAMAVGGGDVNELGARLERAARNLDAQGAMEAVRALQEALKLLGGREQPGE